MSAPPSVIVKYFHKISRMSVFNRVLFFFSFFFSSFFKKLFSILNLISICMGSFAEGQWRPGRKNCTFSIFVLCTALLILYPIMYYLKASVRILLQRSCCVYVNNTNWWDGMGREGWGGGGAWGLAFKKKKKKNVAKKTHPYWCHEIFSRRFFVFVPFISFVALPFKTGVS